MWLQLDADGNGSIDLDEFVSGLLDRPAADREVFLVYMNDDGNLPADLVGDALRALGHNPSDAEVIRIVRTRCTVRLCTRCTRHLPKQTPYPALRW